MIDREKIDTSGAMLRGLIGSDPAAAEKYFLALPEAQRSTQTLSEMLGQYSNTYSKRAFDFALSLQDPQQQTAAVTGLFNNWRREDPEGATEGWKKLPPAEPI